MSSHNIRIFFVVIASLMIAGTLANPAQSQVTGGFDNQIYDFCPTPNCAGAITPNKDTRYTDLQIKGAMQPINNSGQNGPGGNANTTQVDPGAQGAMPSAAMPNKATPVMSLVNNFPMAYFNIDPQQQCNSNQIYPRLRQWHL